MNLTSYSGLGEFIFKQRVLLTDQIEQENGRGGGGTEGDEGGSSESEPGSLG